MSYHLFFENPKLPKYSYYSFISFYTKIVLLTINLFTCFSLILFYDFSYTFSNLKNLRLTFQVTDVLPARIRACVARPGLAKCGGAKYRRGRSPNDILRNPNRRIGGEQLPFVMRSIGVLHILFTIWKCMFCF